MTIIDKIREALNTEETGSALIEVARNSHNAEMRLARVIIYISSRMRENPATWKTHGEKLWKIANGN